VRLGVVAVDRAVLFRLATSERFERVVKGVPGGDAQAWRAASRYVAGRSRDEALIATVDLDPSQRADTSGDSAVVSLLAMPAGSVSELSLDSRLWMRPLPTPGPLLMVIRWQALGIEETVAELDGTALATAGASATILWPPVPPDDRQPPPPPPPPTNGWFADNR